MSVPQLVAPYLKLLTVIAVVVMSAMMFALYKVGRKLRTSREIRGFHDRTLLTHHKRIVAGVFALVVLAFIVIETQVQLSVNATDRYPPLLLFHLFIVGLFVLAMFATLRFNGVKYGRLHARLVYADFALFAMSGITGLWMLPQL